MFTDIHYLDATRLTAFAHPFPYYLFLTIPFLYAITRTTTVCLFRPLTDPPFNDSLTSNKPLATAGNPRDPKFLLGLFAGAFILMQSNVAAMIYVSAGPLYSVLTHRPL